MANEKKFNGQKGFVGLASLIGVTFLLIATVVGVNVVTNRGLSLSILEQAEDVYLTDSSSPSPTPALKVCVTRVCQESSCIGSTSMVPNSEACPFSNCTSNSDCRITPTPKPTSSPTATPITSCQCVNGRYEGSCGHSSGYPCGTTVKTSSPTATPITSCQCVNGRWNSACGHSTAGTSCGTGTTTENKTTTEGCSCVNGRYTGTVATCGHSLGYPCANMGKICDSVSCNNSCGSGFVGTCSGGDCTCTASSTTSIYNTPNCAFPGSCPGKPSEEYIAGTTACQNNPNSNECKEWNKKLTTEAAIVGATLLTPYLIPEIGTAAFAYGSAGLTTALASSPLWLQNMLKTIQPFIEPVINTSVVGSAVSACSKDPSSLACASALAGTDLALSNYYSGLSTKNYVPKNTNNTKNYTTVYRGVKTANQESAYNQVSNMLRSTPDNNLGVLAPENSNLAIQSNEKLQQAVINLGENPTKANFQEVINNAVSPIQKQELELTLRSIENYQSRLGVDFDTALMRTHVDTINGALNTSPYVSVSTSLKEAFGYSSNGSGGIVVANVPNSRITPVFPSMPEVAVQGLILPEEVVGFISTSNMSFEQIQNAINLLILQ